MFSVLSFLLAIYHSPCLLNPVLITTVIECRYYLNNGSMSIQREIPIADIGQVFTRFTVGLKHLTAHLISFFESWNGHPTNSLALCKNHH